MLAYEEKLAPGVLISLSRTELPSHFRTLASSAPIDQYEAITIDLLNKVHSGAIPAEIFGVWFAFALRRLPGLLKNALFDQQSNGVWTIGLSNLSRILRKGCWKEQGWDVIGGLEGICAILDSFGAAKARVLLKLIGHRLRTKGPEAERLVDGLAHVILLGRGIDIPTDVTYSRKSLSRQPRLSDLTCLLRSCSSQFLTQLLSKPLPSNFPVENLLFHLSHCRVNLLRGIATGLVEVDPDVRIMVIENLVSRLISSGEPYYPRFTHGYSLPPEKAPGVYFCQDVIQSICIGDIPSTDLSDDYISTLLGLEIDYAVRRRMPFQVILQILQSGISIQNSKFDIKITDDFVSKLLTFWGTSINPSTGINVFHGPNTRKRLLSHPSRPKVEHEDALQTLLINLLQNLPKDGIKPSKLSSILKSMEAKLSPAFEPSSWLPFIKLMCRYHPRIQVDLEQAPPSEEEWARFRWGSNTLDMLSPGDSKWLFERIASMDLESETLSFELVRNMSEEFSRWYGIELLKVKWESHNAPPTNDFVVARSFIEELKKKARSESDSDKRCQFTKCTIDAAVCSMDIGILKDVMTWSKRYIRDPLVFREISDHNIEGISRVLACVQLPSSRASSLLSNFTGIVHEANQIIRQKIETATLWRLEPSYDKQVSGKFERFILSVVKDRIEGIRLGRCLGIGNEEDLANILLHSMIPICIELERFVTDDKYNLSGYATTWCGPLHYLTPSPQSKSRVLSFLDELAKQRNELWAQLRLEKNPSVAVLGDGWPKGLPSQALLPSEGWAIAAMAEPDVAPYVSSRLNDILFCDPKIARAEISINKKAIGKFIDDLPYAARAYIGEPPSKDVVSKFWKVWEYYAENIPVAARHMHALGSKVIGHTNDAIMREITALTEPPVIAHLPPVDPSCLNATSVEWDPCSSDDNPTQDSKFLDIKEPNILDYRLVGGSYDLNISYALTPVNEVNLNHEGKAKSSKIWDLNTDTRRLPLRDRESLALSAILYLDTLAGTTRTLSKPFPENTTHPRYPSLFLSYNFLSRIGKLSNPVNLALGVLKTLKTIVPSALLKDLATSLLESLLSTPESSSKHLNIRVATIPVIELLSFSDQPQMAVDLSLNIIQDMPDASSWHRRVVSLHLIKNMSFADSENMLERFRAFVVSCLEQRKKNLAIKGDTQPGMGSDKDSNDGKWVKITTIKMLAQLVRSAPFLSHQVSLGILQSLFAASQQKDVRKSIVLAMLDLLKESIGLDGNAVPAVYSGLREMVSVVVGPSEKYTVLEGDWEAAKHDPKLLPTIDNDRPLFMLVTITAQSMLPSCLHGPYVRDVVLPCLDESSRLHNRWMRIFIQEPESPQLKAFLETLDFGPFLEEAVNMVLESWSRYLPSSYLLRQRSSAMKYLEIDNLRQIEEGYHAKNDDWKSTDAGKHWLSYMQYHRIARPFESLILILDGDIELNATDGITAEDTADEFYERMVTILRNPRVPTTRGSIVSLDVFRDAVTGLYTAATSRPTSEKDLNSVTRSLIKRISADVDSLRTQDWLDNPARKPEILPSSTHLNAFLLPFLEKESTSEDYEQYIEQLVELLDECARSPFYLDAFKHVKKVVFDQLQDADLSACAVSIGTFTDGSDNTTIGCFRVQIANKLLEDLGKSGMEGHPEIDNMLEDWKRSSNEWIRDVGWARKAADALDDYSTDSEASDYDEDLTDYSDDYSDDEE